MSLAADRGGRRHGHHDQTTRPGDLRRGKRSASPTGLCPTGVVLFRATTMIEGASGNLLDADVQALVNPVNTVGVMGKGLALQFKRRFPDVFREYAAACKRGEVAIGRMLVTPTGQLE